MRLARERAGAAVSDLERPTVTSGLEVTADEDESEFSFSRVAAVGCSLCELNDAELRQAHIVFADVEDLIRHRVGFTLFRKHRLRSRRRKGGLGLDLYG